MPTATAAPLAPGHIADSYARLEEKILARDQRRRQRHLLRPRPGRAARCPSCCGEMVRIHAPYTHVPYHQRLDDGVVRFVNNDHCLLSARASMRLTKLMPAELAHLPLAQTVWYMPTGPGPVEPALGKAPGHYVRLYEIEFERQAAAAGGPLAGPGAAADSTAAVPREAQPRGSRWSSAARCIDAYRVFLGLLEDGGRSARSAAAGPAGLRRADRRAGPHALQPLLHHGPQGLPRPRHRRVGARVGWDNAHSVLYAGVPDIAVGPRWYSTYEMALPGRAELPRRARR